MWVPANCWPVSGLSGSRWHVQTFIILLVQISLSPKSLTQGPVLSMWHEDWDADADMNMVQTYQTSLWWPEVLKEPLESSTKAEKFWTIPIGWVFSEQSHCRMRNENPPEVKGWVLFVFLGGRKGSFKWGLVDQFLLGLANLHPEMSVTSWVSGSETSPDSVCPQADHLVMTGNNSNDASITDKTRRSSSWSSPLFLPLCCGCLV